MNNINRLEWFQYNMIFVCEHFLGYKNMMKLFGKRKSRLESKLSQRLDKSQINSDIREVKIIEDKNLSYDDFLKIRKNPIVFKGAAKDWKCCREWSFEFFKENFGNTEVLLNDNEGLIDYNSPQDFEQLRLRDYIDSIKNGSRKYLKFTRDIINANPELKDHLGLEWLRNLWLPNSMREEVVMFISGATTLTPIHAAPSSNFFIQVKGNKTWTMYQPEDRWFLDVRTNRSYYYYSKVDPSQLDEDKFPLQKYAHKMQVTLDEGDVLWVPPFTWHHVYNETPSIGISYRFLCMQEAFQNSFTLMSLIFFATRPNPLTHLYHSTFKKNTVLFKKKYSEL